MSLDVRGLAAELGFDLVGVCQPPPSPQAAEAFQSWLAAGHHGAMAYMGRPDRVARALDPRATHPRARSLVVVGVRYDDAVVAPTVRDDPSRGLLASYAWRADYHDVLGPRLRRLGEVLTGRTGRDAGLVFVDTGPLLERDAAARAGLGFVGKNTMLIHPGAGSWLFLGALLLDVELPTDLPDTRGTCGRCARCLEACPTHAFPEPYVLDSRRCISYLTIELRDAIPTDLRRGLGNRVFGCDICNDVCPYNLQVVRRAPPPTADPDLVAPPLLDLAALDEAAFQTRFAGSPVLRCRRGGFLRNVCVAMGNWGDPAATAPLTRLLHDEDALIRGHAAWALGAVGGRAARHALDAARRGEPDGWVQAEVVEALGAEPVPRKTRRSRSSSPVSDDGHSAGRSSA